MSAEGVWAVVERDMGDCISRVYPDEVSALRSAVENGWGRVQFIKWGEVIDR